MMAENTGVWIAMGAILVQAPRLVLAVLAADRQSIAASWERALLILAGFGTALVLTGGNPYLGQIHMVSLLRQGCSASVMSLDDVADETRYALYTFIQQATTPRQLVLQQAVRGLDHLECGADGAADGGACITSGSRYRLAAAA